MTAQQLRQAVQAVVQAHHTHNTFYSIWSDAKDRETELTYPCAVWDSWRTWIEEDGAGALNRSVAVRLLIVTAVATDRTPGDRDAAVEAADQAAEDYILKLRDLYPDMAITNVATTTQFDEYTQLETGVILSFTATGGPLCLDGSAFGPVCAAGVVVNSNGTFTISAPSGGTTTLPDVTHTDSDGTPVVLPGMVSFVATACATSDPGEAYPVDTDGTPVGPAVPVPSGASVPVTAPDGSVRTSDGSTEVMPIKSGEIKPLPKSKILYIDATGSDVFTELYDNRFDGELFPAITIPRRELLNRDGESVSSPATYVTLDHLIDDTLPLVPNNTININSAPFANVPSGGALNVPVKDTDGVPRGSKVGSEWIVPASPLKFTFPIRDQYASWMITADEAGPYNAWTNDGASGTFTYRLGGTGSYAAPSGTVTLVAGVLIEVMRTVTTAEGWQRWQRS